MMNKKYLFQILQDITMLVVLIALIGYHLWGELLHEWFGVLFLCLVVSHLYFSFYWIKRLFQGKYDLFRIIKSVINLSILLLFIIAMISGLMLSQYVLPEFVLHSTSNLVRKTHMASVHWIQIMIALHLGMNWKMLANYFSNLWGIALNSLLVRKTLPVIFIIISLYGIRVFWSRNIYDYLSFNVDYAFFNFDESKLFFYIEHLSMMVLFAYLTRILLWFFLFRADKTAIK